MTEGPKHPLAAERETCWVEVDLTALRRNFRVARNTLPRETSVITVIKANAYGHGAVEVGRTLLEEGAAVLGVATVAEGRDLRKAGIDGRILVLGRTVASELDAAIRWHLAIAVPHLDLARSLSELAVKRGVTVEVHLKVDTGMTRLGVPWEEAHQAAAAIRDLEGLTLSGVFSHFANADLADAEVTRVQVERFRTVQDRTAEAGIEDVPFPLATSAAILTSLYPEETSGRPGLMLYGSSPSEHIDNRDLTPALTWKCRIVQVRDVPAGTGISYGHDFVTERPSRIATVSVGYADGYPRILTNRSQVLISGRRAPVVGRVTMDMIMADITGDTEAAPGDEVVLLGRQGDEVVSAEELASLAGTINYEIYCGISQRVPRFYLNDKNEIRDLRLENGN